MGRNALFGTAVMAALGVPFALSDKQDESSTPAAARDAAAAARSGSRETSESGILTSSTTARSAEAAPLEGPAVANLAEILRFDITPAWLTQRWPRVMNARHASSALQAYRVPLVTGGKASDLAGSLTYYFDEQQKLQRIQFQGQTGDADPLADFLARQYGFERRMSGDPGQIVYSVRRDGKAVSQLTIQTSPLIDASAPQSRFRVELVLQRPSEHRMFSNAAGHRFDSHRWP
jgi:hypothetical protein